MNIEECGGLQMIKITDQMKVKETNSRYYLFNLNFFIIKFLFFYLSNYLCMHLLIYSMICLSIFDHFSTSFSTSELVALTPLLLPKGKNGPQLVTFPR